MKNDTKTNLKEMIELIQKQELLLPDFQRGFVWDIEMQQRLVASVLTKMPIGSILVLEADTEDFGCRILGRKDEVDTSGGNRNVNVLLDGQQRMTALANVFSNQLFYDYSGSGKLMTDYRRLISVDLQNRFFLRIPSVENLDEKEDWFHLKELQFAMTSPESDVPEFLTGDIREDIVYFSYDEKTQEVYAPHAEKPQNIGNFCLKEDYYYIPLFLLINNRKGDSSNETRLKNILKDIVTRVVRYRSGGDGVLAYDFLKSPGTDPAVAPAQDVEVTVNPGTTFRTLTPELVRFGAVRNADKFILLLRWMNYRDIPHALKPGRFRINTGWTPQQVIDQLVNGSPLLDRVTIPEGLAWWEVGKRLEEAQMVRFEDFDKLVHDPAFLRHWGIPFDSAEGFLFPDTYLIMRPLELNEATAKSVVGRLIDNFWRRTAPLWPGGKRPGPSGRDEVRRLVTLASIVERETAVPSERPRVAGVYANRLRLNMLLQADPTTAYGLGEGFDGNLRRKHLDDEGNPYNTYKHPGLPPGPICSPGLACLKAAANPEQHDYIYFVARGEDGSHVFSTNLAAHNNAFREYWAKTRGK